MLTLLTIVVTAVILVAVAAITPQLEIDGFGSALTPGMALAVVWWAVGYLLGFIMPREGFGPFGSWLGFVSFQWVLNTVILGLASLMTPGIRFRSWGTFLITSILVNVAVVLGPYAMAGAWF